MAGYFRLAAADIHNRQRMLDVGCDIGLLLEVARNDGFKELYGLEPVAVAKADAVKRLPERIFPNSFMKMAFSKMTSSI